jgi:6-pyruvoyltetrahydropterin/6-carboxytetrahydropterin synthase
MMIGELTMYEVGVQTTFEAAHRLVGDFGPATRMHGHTYRLEAIVRGPQLQADGTLCDITIVQRAVNAIAADLHYQNLDEVPGLAGTNTTAERVADYCRQRIAGELHGLPLHSLRVVIWENPSAYAAVDGPLGEGA